MKWHEPIKDHFTWGIPDAMWLGVKVTLGEDFDVDSAHVLSMDEDSVRVLLVAGDCAHLVTTRGDETTVVHLGPLVGTFEEIVDLSKHTGRARGVFTDNRLDEPIEFSYPVSDDMRSDAQRALREKLRDWAERNPSPQA